METVPFVLGLLGLGIITLGWHVVAPLIEEVRNGE